MFLCLFLAVKLHYIVEVVSVVHVLVDKILFAINLHDDVVEASAHKYHPGCVWPWFIVTVRLIISKAVCHIKPSKKRNAPAKKNMQGHSPIAESFSWFVVKVS